MSLCFQCDYEYYVMETEWLLIFTDFILVKGMPEVVVILRQMDPMLLGVLIHAKILLYVRWKPYAR